MGKWGRQPRPNVGLLWISKYRAHKLGPMQSNLLTVQAVIRKTNFVRLTKLEEELSVFVCGIRIRMQNFEEVAVPQKAA